MNPTTFRSELLAYIESLRCPDAPGQYRYARSQTEPVLYNSLYAAMGRHLLDDLGELGGRERDEWIRYIRSFQDDDGFFKDERLAHEGSWYVPPHMDWCGWWHTVHWPMARMECVKRFFGMRWHDTHMRSMESPLIRNFTREVCGSWQAPQP